MKQCFHRIWNFWFSTRRVDIQNWGDYKEALKEGVVESYAEFKELWLADFSEPVQWHKFTVVLYEEQLHMSLGGHLQFSADVRKQTLIGVDVKAKEIRQLFRWIENQLSGNGCIVISEKNSLYII